MISPLNTTHGSVLHGFMTANSLVQYCANHDLRECAIADYSFLELVNFHAKCIGHGIKPIIGYRVKLSDGGEITVYAINKDGLHDLFKITSIASRSVDDCGSKNLICVDGYLNSNLANLIFSPNVHDCLVENEDDFRGLVINNWHEKCIEKVNQLKQYFSRVYLGVQNNLPVNGFLNKAIVWLGKKTSLPVIPFDDARYISQEDASLHRILTCIEKKTNLYSHKTQNMSVFFHTDNYNVKNINGNGDLINNLKDFYSNFQEYQILQSPRIPKFSDNDDELLKSLVSKRMLEKNLSNDLVYTERCKRELDVLTEAGISGYLLIVNDYIRAAKNRGETVGVGRGSSAGSLVSYLLNIVDIDPIQHELSFERFYNTSRKGSLPDIDTDFMVTKRQHSIDYIKTKYGHDNVGGIITINKLMGRSAIKEVLRISGNVAFSTINKITENIPDKSKIADELEEIDEEDRKVLYWTLLEKPDLLKEWVTMDKNGELHGEFSSYFDKALKLEGIYRNIGKHPAGLIIGDQSINSSLPVMFDKHNEQMVGLQYTDAEKMGALKVDILGVSAIDKIHNCFQDILCKIISKPDSRDS